MTLAQTENGEIYQVRNVEIKREADLDYLRSGLRAGSWLHVLCKHPHDKPLIFEIEIDNGLQLMVSKDFAERIHVDKSKSSRR